MEGEAWRGIGDGEGRWRLRSGVSSKSGYSSVVTRAESRVSDSWSEARAESWTFCFSMIGARAESRELRTSEAVSWEDWRLEMASGKEARRARRSLSMAEGEKGRGAKGGKR